MGSNSNSNADCNDMKMDLQYDNYLFQIAELPDGKINIEVFDFKAFQAFRVEQFAFKSQANVHTLIAALQKKQEKYLQIDVSKEIATNSQTDTPQLVVVLKITYEFIPHFDERILLSLSEGDNEIDQLQKYLRLVNNKLQTMQDELSTQIISCQKKHVFVVKSGTYQQNFNSILNFELPKGKYHFELTFFANSTEKWIYLKLNQNSTEILNLVENGFYLPQDSQSVYDPLFLQGQIEVKNDLDHFNLFTSESDTYSWAMLNLIFTANRLL